MEARDTYNKAAECAEWFCVDVNDRRSVCPINGYPPWVPLSIPSC